MHIEGMALRNTLCILPLLVIFEWEIGFKIGNNIESDGLLFNSHDNKHYAISKVLNHILGFWQSTQEKI
jgi:hypothetical protein